jgi:hypothetical protein
MMRYPAGFFSKGIGCEDRGPCRTSDIFKISHLEKAETRNSVNFDLLEIL